MKRAEVPCAHQWSAIGNASYLRVLCHRCGVACRLDRRRLPDGQIQVVTALEQRNPARAARVDAPEFVAFKGDTLEAITAVYQVPAVRRFLAGSTNPLPLPGFDEEVRR